MTLGILCGATISSWYFYVGSVNDNSPARILSRLNTVQDSFSAPSRA